MEALTEESGRERCRFEWVDVSVAELLLFESLILRQRIDSTPGWVVKTND